jgi:hypothetical protein
MTGKTPKAIRDRRKEERPKKKSQDKPSPGWDWKFGAGIVLAIAGLILGALGLQARPTVSLDQPLDPRDIFSSPFVISNDGALGLNDVDVYSYVVRAVDVNGNVNQNQAVDHYAPPAKRLDAGEKRTVPFRSVAHDPNPLVSADVALIVDFTPSYLPFWNKERAYRFTTVVQANGRPRFVPQPAGDVLEKFRNLMKQKHGVR